MRKLTQFGPSVVVLVTAMLVLFAGPAAVRQLAFAQSQATVRQASDRLLGSNILEEINRASRDIAKAVEPSVVHISVDQVVPSPRFDRPASEQISSGSGWIFDHEGHIVTNHHVVKGARRIEVQMESGERRPAEIVGADEFTDIAVIKVPPGRLQPARLGDPAEMVEQGDLVFAFGSPFDFRFSMSQGVVSGKGRSVGVIQDGFENFIQVDAAINPGNSGGPLTNFRGEVIGMNTAIATGGRRTTREGAFSGIGLAIPLEMIVPTVSQLIETGVVRKGFLGISIDQLNSSRLVRAQRDAIRSFRGRGVVVTNVDAGGPADLAGVQPGDVITTVNNTRVGTVEQLRSMISSMIPGEDVELAIWRNSGEAGEPQTVGIVVTLDRLSTLRVAGTIPDDQARDRIPELGIARMSTLNRELAREYEIRTEKGVLIEALVKGMPLDRVLDPGAVIVQIGTTPVENVDGLLEALRQYNLSARYGATAEVILPSGESRPVTLYVPNG